jgi:hypothetical protein
MSTSYRKWKYSMKTNQAVTKDHAYKFFIYKKIYISGSLSCQKDISKTIKKKRAYKHLSNTENV